MLNRKWTLISLGGLVIMVILGTFLRSRQAPIAAKQLVEKAEHYVRSIKKKVESSPAEKTEAKVATATEEKNPFAEWDRERLEKEVIEQNAVEKLNSKDLPADDRQELTQLILALQESREAWVKDQVKQIEDSLAQAESEQAQKLSETREKILAARQTQ